MSIYVGIGTSAGGVEALQTLFVNMPLDSDVVFFVVQHLLPNTETMMDKILQQVTPRPVQLVSDGLVPEKNHIYLNVPDKIMVLRGGQICLEDADSAEEKYTPINQFLESLASDIGCGIGAVILTGSGSDGAIGVSAIKKAGGFVIVQDPSEAQYPSMPQQVITAELADVQLPLAQIGAAIASYVNNPAQYYLKNEELLTEFLQMSDYQQILSELNQFSGIDFTAYKAHTVVRRIEQRIAMNKLPSVHEYVEFFRSNQEEKKMLCKTLLVGVTSFFRDGAAFTVLQKEVLPSLILSAHAAGRQLRIWCVACSTGEEAYSLVISLLECMENIQKAVEVKVFATDLDNESIAFAQKGVYSSQSLKTVSPLFIEKYFTAVENGFVINEDVRRMVIFAQHNIFKDPPFSNLDLISCRNMLIYVKQKEQNEILSIFEQMLCENGYLFLGSSESLGSVERTFAVINRKWKIFRKNMQTETHLFNRMPVSASAREVLHDSRYVRSVSADREMPEGTFTAEIIPKLFAAFAGPSIIVNSVNTVVQVIEGGGKCVRIQDGLFSDSLDKLFPKDLVSIISFFITELAGDGESSCTQRISSLADYPGEILELRIQRLPVDKQNYFLIRIDSEAEASIPSDGEQNEPLCLDKIRDKHINMLEEELRRAQMQLKQFFIEAERRNEELQSANEELLASNEELQSTNEEMSSVNEELYTLNAEYQNKITELTTANADFDNLLNNAEIGALYIGQNMEIRKITPLMMKKTNLLITDIGRPINQINFMYSYPGFIHDVEKVFDDGGVIEKCITDADNCIWLIRIRQYFLSDNQVHGILVTLFDVTKQLRAAQLQIDTLIDSVPGGVLHLTFDTRLVIDYANKGFYSLIGYTEDEIQQKFQNRFDKLIFQEDRRALSRAVVNASNDNPIVNHTCRMVCKNGEYIWISIQAIMLLEDEKICLYCTVLDISAIKNFEEHILREKAQYDVLYQNLVCGIVQYEKSDNTLRCYHANDEAIHMLGLKNLEEFREQNKQTLSEVSIGDEVQVVIRQLLALKEVGEGVAFEHRVERADGSIGWVRGYAKVVVSAEGKILIQSTFVDVTKEKESLMLIDQERRQYQALYNVLYNTAVCGIVQVDLYNHKILSINKEAMNILHASQEDIGSAIFAAETGGNKRAALSELGEFVRSVNNVSGADKKEIIVTLGNGTQITLQCSIDEINLDNEGKIVQLTFIDITGEQQLKETEMRLEITEKTSKAKSLFLSKMSHEIRTPMNAIVGMIEILRLNIGDQERVTDCLEKMSRSMRHLKLLVNDVLDMSKIESGKMRLEYVPSDLSQLLIDIIDEFRFEADSKKIQLFFDNKIVHSMVQIDAVRLREIIGNLLNNAIKFTDNNGSVRLTVTENVQCDSSSIYTFKVKDTGCGIKPENIKVIFDAFEQGHDTHNYGKAGTGLGLSICKNLVEMMNGNLEVCSTVGEGSEFYFSIPVNYTVQQQNTLQSECICSDKFAGCKVLFAEDNELNHEIVQTLLETYGFIVDGAWNGRELLEHFEQQPDNYFDFILVDIQMPVMNGLEAAQAVRQSDKPDAKTIPIIAMSANAFEDDIKASLDAGMNAHVAKPMDICFLLQTLADCLPEEPVRS